ncbi:MAG: hypothetical protein JST26_19215 [Bacteroidetes bacterium]|nr:hypothetical protein [Bacteroidota bacterium]
MPQQYINKISNSRKKLIIRTVLFLLAIIAIAFIQYLISSNGHEKQERHFYRNYISPDGLKLIIVSATVISLIFVFYATLIIRLVVDIENDELIVEYIPRFKLKAIEKRVKLSETYLQFDSATKKNKFFHKKEDDYFVIYLNHKAFGQLKVSALEFGSQIEQIFKDFETLKTHAANNVWRHRQKASFQKRRGVRNPDSKQN